MFKTMQQLFLATSVVLAAALPATAEIPANLQESPYWQSEIDADNLPPVAERIPQDPLIVDLAVKGREFGRPGGTLRTMITRSKDIRQMVAYGYARLVGFDHNYNIVPDLLASYENRDNRKFTLYLRPGHKWSDGTPFTSEDFRYWWEDVANNELLSPSGPPEFLLVEGKPPTVSFPGETTVIFEWDDPNPNFLQSLAQARPPFIYRPAEFLKQYHEKFTAPEELAVQVEDARVRSWAALHNKLDNLYKFDNHELPTLQPWLNASSGKKIRHSFVRNPYYHRVDAHGVQLPYIDVVEMEIVAPGLVAAKTNAGESDLQGRGLAFRDASILKKGEAGGGYKTLLWKTGVASQIAIYPNLNFSDDGWRPVLRDVRVRRALSLAIDRKTINHALYFKLAQPGAMSVLPASPFYNEENAKAWAQYDIKMANALLDKVGLTQRGNDGIRLLPDGRPMELVIETAGERQEVENALQIVTDTWREIGVKLVMRPLDRDILRNRVFSGNTMASAWFGWDDGIPQNHTSPSFLAPTDQVFLAWPKWGQYYQTGGDAGEPPDMPEAERLMKLAHDWEIAATDVDRQAIWTEMLKIHAQQLYAIGILNGAPQPIVVSNRLRNVPEQAMWAWEPGAHFGVHRPDEFFFVD